MAKKIKDMIICEGHDLSFSALENGRLELCVALSGEWKSRKMKVTQEHLQQMADNFAAEGRDILFDYDHKCLGGFFSEADSRAAGWGKAVRLSDGKLYVEMEPTPKGRELIENKEYRYLSPVYQTERMDRVTGKKIKDWKLHSVALTNTPFLAELPAIKNMEPDGGTNMDELLKLLGAANEDEALAKVKELSASRDALVIDYAALVDKYNAQQSKLNEQEVDIAIQEKKLTPAQKTLAMKLINSDHSLYTELLNSSAPAADITTEVTIPPGEGDPLNPFEKVSSFSDLLKDPELANNMKTKEPVRYAELYNRYMKEGL